MAAALSSPPGYEVRPPSREDLAKVLEVIVACDVEEFGEPDFTEDDLLSDWERIRFDLGKDARVVTAEDGDVVGYTDTWDREEYVLTNPNTCVRPDHAGKGIGTFLIRWAEGRAVELRSARPEAPVAIRNVVSSVNDRARTLLERLGYRPVRHWWRMTIHMDGPPPRPALPDGIEIRTFRPGEERQVHAAVYEAFLDTEGQLQRPFEEWRQTMIDRAEFDPTVWFIALDGPEIAGTALCYLYPEEGWVRQLTVKKPWRGRGLGLALLHHSFGEFHRRGQPKAGLVVDSKNSTGATRLYERAGMRVSFQHDEYEKTIPPRG